MPMIPTWLLVPIPVWALVLIVVPLVVALAALKRERRLRKAAEQDARQAWMTDPNTGIGNLRAFEEGRRKAHARARRQLAGEERRKQTVGTYVCAELDVVQFARINNTYGQRCGDRVIVAIAEVLRRTFVRPTDSVFRTGGDEFAILMRDTTEEGAQVAIGRLKQNLRSLSVPDGRGGQITSVEIRVNITEGNGDMSDQQVAEMQERSGTFEKESLRRDSN